MNRDDKNFLALKQADAKLELALQRYQQPDVEADMRTEYLRYLRLRIRPAMDRLIREGNVRTLQELIGQIPPDESSLKMAMQVAGDSGQGECFAWLWNYRRKRREAAASGMEPGKEAAASPTSGVQSGLEEQKYPAFSGNENRYLAKNGESQEKNGAPNDFMETKAVALAERIWAYIRDLSLIHI